MTPVSDTGEMGRLLYGNAAGSEGETMTSIAQVELRVPLALATGKYEDLTEEELNDHYIDIQAEICRRMESNAGQA